MYHLHHFGKREVGGHFVQPLDVPPHIIDDAPAHRNLFGKKFVRLFGKPRFAHTDLKRIPRAPAEILKNFGEGFAVNGFHPAAKHALRRLCRTAKQRVRVFARGKQDACSLRNFGQPRGKTKQLNIQSLFAAGQHTVELFAAKRPQKPPDFAFFPKQCLRAGGHLGKLLPKLRATPEFPVHFIRHKPYLPVGQAHGQGGILRKGLTLRRQRRLHTQHLCDPHPLRADLASALRRVVYPFSVAGKRKLPPRGGLQKNGKIFVHSDSFSFHIRIISVKSFVTLSTGTRFFSSRSGAFSSMRAIPATPAALAACTPE